MMTDKMNQYFEEPTEEEVQQVEEDIFEWKDEDENDPTKRAKRIWKSLNPEDTLKESGTDVSKW